VCTNFSTFLSAVFKAKFAADKATIINTNKYTNYAAHKSAFKSTYNTTEKHADLPTNSKSFGATKRSAFLFT
jgi:hypothetical protein